MQRPSTTRTKTESSSTAPRSATMMEGSSTAPQQAALQPTTEREQLLRRRVPAPSTPPRPTKVTQESPGEWSVIKNDDDHEEDQDAYLRLCLDTATLMRCEELREALRLRGLGAAGLKNDVVTRPGSDMWCQRRHRHRGSINTSFGFEGAVICVVRSSCHTPVGSQERLHHERFTPGSLDSPGKMRKNPCELFEEEC